MKMFLSIHCLLVKLEKNVVFQCIPLSFVFVLYVKFCLNDEQSYINMSNISQILSSNFREINSIELFSMVFYRQMQWLERLLILSLKA